MSQPPESPPPAGPPGPLDIGAMLRAIAERGALKVTAPVVATRDYEVHPSLRKVARDQDPGQDVTRPTLTGERECTDDQDDDEVAEDVAEVLENPPPWVRRAHIASDEAALEAHIAEMLQTPEGIAELERDFGGVAATLDFAEFCQFAWPTIEPATRLQWSWHHNLLAYTLQALFETWLVTKDSTDPNVVPPIVNTVISCPPGSLKPVHVDGVVLERTRGNVRLGDVCVGDEVLTHAGRFRRVLAVSDQGVLPLYEIKTSAGRLVRAAADHPILTQRGWVRADQITSRDVLAQVHTVEDSGTRTISLEESRLLGYLIGDGCLSQKFAASFTNQDPETITDFVMCCQALGFEGRVKPRAKSYAKLNARVVSVCGGHGGRRADGKSGAAEGPVKLWLRHHTLERTNSYTKHVPPAVLAGDNEVVAEYLAAYWSCDGGIHDRRDLPRAGRVNQVTTTVRIDAHTQSIVLAEQHQELLRRLGLSFKLRRKITKLTKAMCGAGGEKIGQEYASWQLVAADQDTCAKFMQVIGPRMRHEKRRRAAGLERTRFDAVLHADAVVEITTGTSGECRCLQVEEDSSFVYQGIAVHNSKIVAVLFPAWIWLRAPGTKIICISVNETAELRDARAARDLIRSPWFQKMFSPQWSIRDDQDAISNYGNTEGGERISKPSGSVIVGQRGDWIFCDDLNDPLAAEVEKERDKVNKLWSTNQYNRVNDPIRSMRVCVQQRIHGMDHTGFILQNQGHWSPTNREGWLNVVLPAEYDPTRKFVMPPPLVDALRRAIPDAEDLFVLEDPRTIPGESVDPVRFPASYLAAERKRWEGTSNYSGQMLQSPALAEGSRIKREYWGWFRLAGGVRDDIDALETGRPRPEHCIKRRVLDDRTVMGEAEVIRAKHHSPGEWDFDWVELHVDPAVKKTERGSNWGMVVMAGKGARRYVLDDRTQRGDILEIVEVLRSTIRMWHPSKVCIEDKAAGEELRKRLLEEMTKGDMPMVTLELIKIKGNQGKDERLDACIAVLANGMVSLLDSAPWLEEFVKELASYPFYATNDRVDVVTQCLNHHMEFEDESWPSF